MVVVDVVVVVIVVVLAAVVVMYTVGTLVGVVVTVLVGECVDGASVDEDMMIVGDTPEVVGPVELAVFFLALRGPKPPFAVPLLPPLPPLFPLSEEVSLERDVDVSIGIVEANRAPPRSELLVAPPGATTGDVVGWICSSRPMPSALPPSVHAVCWRQFAS